MVGEEAEHKDSPPEDWAQGTQPMALAFSRSGLRFIHSFRLSKHKTTPECDQGKQLVAPALALTCENPGSNTQAILVMTTTGSKPKEKGLILRKCIDFVFGFENKKGEILDSWIVFADSFNFPPQEFYAAIEKEID